MPEGYYQTKSSVQEYITLAKGVNGSKIIEKLKRHLPSPSSLLELGSGPGTDWRLLSNLYSVVGSDNSLEFLRHLKSESPDGEFIHLDAMTLKTPRKFDGIYSNKVLHHLHDEQLTTSVKRQFDILNDQGIVCHSFWKGEGSETFKGLFVNYHDNLSITAFFAQCFDQILIEEYAEFDEGDSILFIGKKKS